MAKTSAFDRNTVEFVTVAAEYCAFLEQIYDKEPTRVADVISKLLPLVYLKASMLTHDVVEELIGHGVGGVCPFAVKEDVEIFIDSSVKRFPSVYPAVGSANSAIELTPEELFEISHALRWVDVCKIPEE